MPRLAGWAAEELGLTLVEPRYEPDLEARKIYLTAQMAWWREEYEGIRELAEEATLLDPEYAEAFALYSMILLSTHTCPQSVSAICTMRWFPLPWRPPGERWNSIPRS